MRWQIDHRLDLVLIPGHHQVGQERERSRDGPLFIPAPPALGPSYRERVNGALKLMHRLAMIEHPSDIFMGIEFLINRLLYFGPTRALTTASAGCLLRHNAWGH